MQRIDIIKYFLKDKIQLQPEVLDFLYENQNLIDKIFEKAKEKKIKLLTLEKVKDLTSPTLTITKPVEIKQFSIKDLQNYLKERFEFLSKILEKKLTSLISINKIKEKNKSFSLIGFVKDKDTNLLLEDKTGRISLNIKKEYLDQLVLDEVIGVECNWIGKKPYVNKLVFPGIPVFHPINRINKDVIISKKAILIDNKKTPADLERALWISIKKFKVLLLTSEVIKPYKRKGENLLETTIRLAEKRHLNPTFIYEKKIYQEDPYLLKEIPDVIIVFDSELSKKNYKGITIFTLPNNYAVNLKTRESIKIT